MKRTQICPRCQGSAVGQLESLPDATSMDGSYQAVGSVEGYRGDYVVERGEQQVILRGQLDSTRRVGRHPTWEVKAGTVEAYLCTTCGHVEHYVQDPQWVAFQRLRGFRWVGELEEEPG